LFKYGLGGQAQLIVDAERYRNLLASVEAALSARSHLS
jgi:hypothetical protein